MKALATLTSTSVPAVSPETRLPSDVREALREALQRNERIDWMEQPSPRHRARAEIGAFWIGVILAVASGLVALVSDATAPWAALLILAFAVGIGVQPLFAYRRAARSVAVITDFRVFVIEPSDGGAMLRARGELDTRFYSLTQLRDMEVRRNADGSGDIVIVKHEGSDANGQTVIIERGIFSSTNVDELARRLRAFIDGMSSASSASSTSST